MKKFKFYINGKEIKEPSEESLEIEKIAVQYPHSKEVVQDIFDVVKDLDKTKLILDFSCQRGISVYPILELIKQSNDRNNQAI